MSTRRTLKLAIPMVLALLLAAALLVLLKWPSYQRALEYDQRGRQNDGTIKNRIESRDSQPSQ